MFSNLTLLSRSEVYKGEPPKIEEDEDEGIQNFLNGENLKNFICLNAF